MITMQSCSECGNETDRDVVICEQCNDDDCANTQAMSFAIEQLEAELKSLRAQQPLVWEVIGKLKSYDLHGFDASDRAALIAACRRLAEFKS